MLNRNEIETHLPVIRTSVSLPDKSVTCCNKSIHWVTTRNQKTLKRIWNKKKVNRLTIKVSLNEAKIRATPKTCSPSLTAGPRVTVSSFGSLTFLFDDYKYITNHFANYQILEKSISISKKNQFCMLNDLTKLKSKAIKCL